MAALMDASSRPRTSPGRTSAEIEAAICELRRRRPRLGPRSISHALGAEGLSTSQSSVYRVLVRHSFIEPGKHRRRPADYKRWERSRPMELWQMDVVGGVFLESGTELKIVTGVDDHSRYAVAAGVVERATAARVCQVLIEALRQHGVPEEILTDNGKVFTNRHGKFPMLESTFDRICRENGIVHRLTRVRSPTTTGKIERFHRTLREELLNDRRFATIDETQAAIDAWLVTYNTERPHQSLGMLTPLSRFHAGHAPAVIEVEPLPPVRSEVGLEIQRRVRTHGTVSIDRHDYSVGMPYVGKVVTARIETSVVHFLVDGKVVKTCPRVHTSDNVRMSTDKRHRSRRAADERRRAVQRSRTSG
jgi:transposase InsO family protein